MDEPLLDPEAARERLAAWKGRIDQMSAETKAMGEQMRQLRVVVNDVDRMAEVTVDSTGALVGLKLTDRIERVTPNVVASTIMATLRQARRQLAEKSQEIVADTLGTDSPAARAISESIGQHLGSGPAPSPAPRTAAPLPPVAQSRRPPPLPEDDDNNPSVMDDRW